jgi:hypothetical protein
MKTAIEAAKKLGISRDEFEVIVKDSRIKMVSNGNDQLIQKEDYQHLKGLLKQQTQLISSSKTNFEELENSKLRQSAIDIGQQNLLISELRDQINFLKSQIESEKAHNTELIEQVSQWQKFMMNMQSENKTLRQKIAEYQKNISNNLMSTSLSESSADELASDQFYSGEKSNVFVDDHKDVQQTKGAQAIIENLLRKTFPWGMPSRLPSNVKNELSSHLVEQELGISDSRLNSIVSTIRKNW